MCKCKYVTLKSSRPTAKMRRRHLATVREEPDKKPRSSDLAVYSMVTATAVLSYANSLHGDFVHDDIPAIVTNADVLGTGPLKQLFLNDFWGAPMSDYNSHKSYRPLTTLSFSLSGRPTRTHNSRDDTSTLSASWKGIEYLIEGE